MKNILTLIGLLTVFCTLNAQKPIEVSETNITLGQNEYPGIQLMIPEAGFERVEKMWIKVLEKGTKSDVSEANQGEITIFGAYIKSISDDPVNIYSQIIPHDSIIELNTSVELKRSEFLTEDLYESEFNQLKAYMHDFGKEVYIQEVADQVKAEKEILKELEKELKKLQNEQEGKEKNISKDQHDITVAEDAIRILDADIAVKNEEIAREKVRLSSSGDPVQKETIEEILKEFEKEKKKMQKSIQKEKKNIVGYESDIDNTKLEIPAIINQQNQKMQEIEKQRNRVVQFETKLDIIKGY